MTEEYAGMYGVKGFANMAQDAVECDSMAHKCIEEINTSLNRAEGLVKHLSTFSQKQQSQKGHEYCLHLKANHVLFKTDKPCLCQC